MLSFHGGGNQGEVILLKSQSCRMRSQSHTQGGFNSQLTPLLPVLLWSFPLTTPAQPLHFIEPSGWQDGQRKNTDSQTTLSKFTDLSVPQFPRL